MKRIYDWDAKFCLRNYTVADLLALKGVRKLTQTTANSEEEAAAGTRRKWQNLKASKVKPTSLNFGGVARELVCSGGELGFIQRMIQESHGFGRRALWFTTLVAQQKHLPPLLHSLKRIGAAEVHTLPLSTGNKASRLLAWTFLEGQQREVWRAARWRPAKSGSTRQR